ncbi:RNA polymerase sigma factor [Nocardioides coralli]|uniref:RNA polymerase sigma factor n=1 Tax=Nocardioides coralli TaxID=2872154 RepID=UPI001CA419B8|nr:sigma-70 family RNA polymerase sigma factor [Nocardioides coralli]QZY27785.1 sigma-70 family RNA polymerase sigma factor [Nocardioides coralli]
MTEVPPPDWAALYQKHREAMYRVAARTLRGAGREAEAGDVVMAAMESLMRKPPRNVKNWEAMMVKTTARRALDLMKSAEVKHSSGVELLDQDATLPGSLEVDIAEAVDRQRNAAAAWDKLSILDARHRQVVWEYVAKERPRDEVAAELGVSPARVSQMATKALKQLKEVLEKEGVTP